MGRRGRVFTRPQAAVAHWGREKFIWVSKLTIIGSDNGLAPWRRQAIIWTSAGILLIRSLGINASEILIEINIFSFKKMHLTISSGNRPQCDDWTCRHGAQYWNW